MPTESRAFLCSAVSLLTLVVTASAARAGDWEAIDDEDGIEVFRKDVPGSDVVAFRGKTVFDASIARILGVLVVNEHRTEWVDRLYESQTLEQVSRWEFVVYQAFALPAIMSNRDYVYRGKATLDAATGVVTVHMASEENAKAPETVGVRANLIHSKYTLTPEGPDKTRVDVEIQTDPRGMVPTWIVNLIQKSWPYKTLSALKAQVKKDYVQDYPLPPG